MTHFFALSYEQVDMGGFGGLLQMVLFAEAYQDTVRLASPPELVQRFLFPARALIARATGRRASYPYPGAVDTREPSRSI